MHVSATILKQLEPGGKCLLGGALSAARAPGAVRLLEQIGVGYLEIGPVPSAISHAGASAACQLARALDIAPIVRVNSVNRTSLTLALDGGAMGVSVPCAPGEEAARAVVTWTRYAPIGQRGTAESGPHDDYEGDPQDLASLNAKVHVTLRVPPGIAPAQLRLTVEVEGVDAIEFDGATASEIAGALRPCVDIARQNGVLVTAAAQEPEEITSLANAGVQLVRYEDETAILARFFEREAAQLRHEAERRGAA